MEKNFKGLNESQENLLLLLAEGNTQRDIAEMLGKPYTYVRNTFQTIREVLDAKTNEHAVAILFKDLCYHGNLEKKALLRKAGNHG